MLRLQQVSRLRLVVAIPESEVTGIASGTKLNFTVPAMPGEQFTGVVQRISHAIDAKTCAMQVELDVNNASRRLAPGDQIAARCTGELRPGIHVAVKKSAAPR